MPAKIYYSTIKSLEIPYENFPKIGILLSYYGLKSITKPNICNSLFLDSGAFSAFNKNEIINVYKYIEFVKKYNDICDIYASLDDIGSYKKSIENYHIMLDAGLNPLPTFHLGEPWWVLDEYLKHTNYIALGGVAKKSQRKLNPIWFDIIF